ncbi:FAST kinase domain-containing protein 4 [Varanus komodoensis]|nr:FAST kinase domain-containing protein 4 [Varanus komodoensis]
MPLLAPLAPLATCSLLRQTDKLCPMEQAVQMPTEHAKLEDLIDTSAAPEDLLHLVDVYSVNTNQAARMVIRLSWIVAEQQLDPGKVVEDARFQQLLQVIHKQVSQVWSRALVNVLKSLYLLGLEQSKLELLSVEQEVRWRIRRLPFQHLVSLADHIVSHAQQGKQSELLGDLLKHLELRWAEIEDTRTVVTLMSKVGPFSPALMERLEDKSLELAEQFTTEDTRRVAMALAFQNRRSIPLLRAISYHLVQKQFSLSPSALLDLTFAFGKLNFHQTQVFQKVASELLPHLPALTPSDVVRCAKSFSYLKWLSVPLFEAFAQYAVDNAERFTPDQLSNIILSFARLNFQPSNTEAFYSTVHRWLDRPLGNLNPHLLVDLVWSWCVLRQAKAAHLRKALAPEFCADFLANHSSQGKSYQLKLLHINATARLECADYGGPFLPPDVLDIKKLLGSRKVTPLQSGLREALRGIAGDEARVRFEVDTSCGWCLDAEMVLNSDNQPLPVADFAAPPLAQAGRSRPRLSQTRRLAFLAWEFPNFSNRSKELLGRFALAQRHIRALGFLIIEVPYYEWMDLKSERQKAAYLRDKMNKAVAAEMAR